jgi:hypothetical protein
VLSAGWECKRHKARELTQQRGVVPATGLDVRHGNQTIGTGGKVPELIAAVGGGALAAGALIRTWGRRAAERRMAASPVPIEASDDEMARLEAAIRNDDR